MNTELQYYIQIIAWAYFWVGNFIFGVYVFAFISYLFLDGPKVSIPFNWKAFLFLMFWLISIKLK